MPRAPAVSFRLTEEDTDLIRRLADHLTERSDVRHTQTDVLRVALRQLARREGLTAAGKKSGKSAKEY